MSVDVSTSVVINRPRESVARYAANPDHAPDWYINIKTVEWKTNPPVTVGSQIAFVAHFLGRDHLRADTDVVASAIGQRDQY
jgi:hypothetical protein